MIRFVVVQEHTLGYVDDREPDTVCFLRSSVLRGSPYEGDPLASSMPLPMDPGLYRSATRSDFDVYRVSYSPQYEDRTRYHPLALAHLDQLAGRATRAGHVTLIATRP